MLNTDTLKAIRGALFIRRNTLKTNEITHHHTNEALVLIDSLLAGDTIAELWTVEDIQEAANMIYGVDALGVPNHLVSASDKRYALLLASNDHDDEVGISWDTLQMCLGQAEARNV